MASTKYSTYRNVICTLRRRQKNVLIKMQSGNYFIIISRVTKLSFTNDGVIAEKCGPIMPTEYDLVFMPYESIDNIRSAND